MNPASFSCDECDQQGEGVAIGVTGWFGYPAGWLLKDDAAVCSEKCALAYDERHKPALDTKVADVGGALLAGFFAGAAMKQGMNLLSGAIAKMKCVHCDRTLLEHSEKSDDKCEGFKTYGSRVRAKIDIHYMVSRDEPSGWAQVAVATAYGFTIRKGTLGRIVSLGKLKLYEPANTTETVVRWDESTYNLGTTLSSVEIVKEE